MTWPFEDPRDTPVLTDPSVLDGSAWIFFVQRGTDGHWRFRLIDHFDVGDTALTTTTLGHITELDPTIHQLADLPVAWHAWRQDRNAPWERLPQPEGATYFIQFEATPAQSNPMGSEIAGAIINCWIRASDLQRAIARAREGVIADGWIIDEPDEAYEDRASYYTEDATHFEYFRQAQIDGATFVVHCYPIDEHGE